ncbi:MAG: hypothetical protein U1F87_13260 [Kiritimatiellia bacterium]
MNLETLLAEMCDPAVVARLPDPPYQSLRRPQLQPGLRGARSGGSGRDRLVSRTATERVHPGGVKNARGEDEWVLMEHSGPDASRRCGRLFFYFNFQERHGPNLRVYLDGSPTPVLDEPFIALTRGEGSFKPPFGAATARAGNTYLPIAFARGAKVTLTAKPFYNIINYRAYPEGTPVRTFRREDLVEHAERIAEAGRTLYAAPAWQPGREVRLFPAAPRPSRGFPSTWAPSSRPTPACCAQPSLRSNATGRPRCGARSATISPAPTRFIPTTRGSEL